MFFIVSRSLNERDLLSGRNDNMSIKQKCLRKQYCFMMTIGHFNLHFPQNIIQNLYKSLHRLY